MKEFKNLMIIGVDHGYGNIKTAGTVTKNGVTAYENRTDLLRQHPGIRRDVLSDRGLPQGIYPGQSCG